MSSLVIQSLYLPEHSVDPVLHHLSLCWTVHGTVSVEVHLTAGVSQGVVSLVLRLADGVKVVGGAILWPGVGAGAVAGGRELVLGGGGGVGGDLLPLVCIVAVVSVVVKVAHIAAGLVVAAGRLTYKITVLGLSQACLLTEIINSIKKYLAIFR